MKKNDRRKKEVGRFRLQDGLFLGLTFFSLLFFIAVDGNAAGSADNYPSRPIELVVSRAPGSNSDNFARNIKDVIEREKLLSQPVVVVNKPGGGGAVAYGYVLDRKANPHLIMVVSSTFLTTVLLENLPYNYKAFTPVANLCLDGSVLAVRADSPYKTVEDLIAVSKKRPKELSMGAGSLTGYENMMALAIQQRAGIQWKFVSFQSSSESLVNLLGGHLDMVFSSPDLMVDHVRTGKLRVLLAGAPTRYAAYKDVPTIEEKGLGKPVVSNRGIVGSSNMPAYAVKKLEAALQKVTQSDRWKKTLADQMMQPFWMGSQQYAKWLDEENASTKAMLIQMNLLKK